MAAAYVQSNIVTTGGAADTTIALAFVDQNVTEGGHISGAVTWGSANTADLLTIAGNGNSYTIQRRIADATNGQSMASFFAEDVAGGATTITATFNASLTDRGLVIHEASGLATSASLDDEIGQLQAAPGTGTDGVTSTSATTTEDGDYIVGFTMSTSARADGTSQFVAGTGYVEREEKITNDEISMCSEDQVQSAAGSIAATFTQDTARSAITFIMAFKVPGAAGGGPNQIGRCIYVMP